MIGSVILRACAVGAIPFLLPIMLQVGFGFTPFESGTITFIGALATLLTKLTISKTLKQFGFRSFLISTAIFSAVSTMLLALISQNTAPNMIIAVIFSGALFRALYLTAIETMIFADIVQADIGKASSLLSVAKQLAAAMGVAFSALILQGVQLIGGTMALDQYVLQLTLLIIAMIIALTTPLFSGLSVEDGAELAGNLKAKN